MRRGARLGGLLAGVLVTAAAFAVSAGAHEATSLPTVRCPVTAGIGGLEFPHWPARQSAVVPASLAGRLAVYVGGFQRVVAPRGWRCRVQEGADGSDVMRVTEPTEGLQSEITSWAIPACVGCIYFAVCAYFPSEARSFNVGIACDARPAGERVTRLSRTLVHVTNSSRRTQRLILFNPRRSTPAAGVSCSGDSGICAAVLADWRATTR